MNPKNADKYIRDKRSPVPKSEAVSRVMSSNKAKNTSPELILRKAIYSAGLRGYRLHSKKVLGKPDIIFVKKKIAIFVDGCFWHGCKKHASVPRTNVLFWKEKIARNKERDKEVNRKLRKDGWKVSRIWEHELKNIPALIHSIVKKIND